MNSLTFWKNLALPILIASFIAFIFILGTSFIGISIDMFNTLIGSLFVFNVIELAAVINERLNGNSLLDNGKNIAIIFSICAFTLAIFNIPFITGFDFIWLDWLISCAFAFVYLLVIAFVSYLAKRFQ